MQITLATIPLTPNPQVFSLAVEEYTYRFRLVYSDVPEGGWVLDILTVEDDPIVCGIPLVTGVNLLGQYGYLGLGFGLYVATQGNKDAVPTFNSLGVTSNLYITRIA